ncbi:MAG: metal-dependent transcriptional regulator [Erysipelotrichaceae bacterium]|nr:metal-dependent transcriptional regulator [Erysipelotrichaceae bacterium]MBQ1533654.1 metal-dependent transcriptional regulator [Erysipelotrichaceae bacterium]MBQ1787810.1 metal-dependent transcriptional regulator [Erysipelotrichaceae bacterium]MBQ5804477.1 metal-dependent transcriptional regulator [Erysipelotrichaceae bacterium]
MTIQESAEMYMETIHILSLKNKNVRAIDISRYMNFSKPSVSRAMKNLSHEGYVSIDVNGNISLTEKGLRIAEGIYEKHRQLTDFFVRIGVSPETAEEDACRIEHVISDETFEAIKKL